MPPLRVRLRPSHSLLFLIGMVLALFVPLACSRKSGSDSAGGDATRSLSTGRKKARQVDDFLINYGAWDSTSIAIAKQYDVVVVHPSQGLTRQIVQDIQQGVNPNDPSDDVLVLGYVSIGEDMRTSQMTDAEMLQDPRFVGDGTGPRIDPRGHRSEGGPLEGIAPLGAPSSGGVGYASWYLDDNSVDRNGVGDGKPDRNTRFGACFVNAGDPKWFDVIDAMTLDGIDRQAGLAEVLTTSQGRGLGCDGVFLDTFDTCAPNHFTSPGSSNPSEFEWTAPGFAAFMARLRAEYPDRVILQNRGLFFFDVRFHHYKHTTRSNVDLVLFESFRLNSNAFEGINPIHYADNRHNVAPKLMAEANRPDGFRVVSLGYAEGPPNQMSREALWGTSTLGFNHLLEDIRVCEQENGFRHYISDGHVVVVNDFVRAYAERSDSKAPVWSSTWNSRSPSAPDPRPGVRELVAGAGSLTVRWDVALDLNPVRYAAYVKTVPFDFAADPSLATATRIVLTPEVGDGYADGPGPAAFPYQAVLGGLTPGQTYYVVIRAFDSSPAANEDRNTVVKSGAPH